MKLRKMFSRLFFVIGMTTEYVALWVMTNYLNGSIHKCGDMKVKKVKFLELKYFLYNQSLTLYC